MRFQPRSTAITACSVCALMVLGACTDPLDYDMRGRGQVGGFSTSDAARGATTARPKPDSRGVITYPNYQVAVVRGGDTALSVAQRLGIDGNQLARYNGVAPDVKLRSGEILALPRKLPGASNGSVDIASLAGAAIDNAPDTSPVETSTLQPAAPAPAPAEVQTGPEPVRHKVERGETAYTIARLYQVPVSALAEWNGLGADFAVREGQFLLIPVVSQSAPAASGAAAAGTSATTEPGEGSPTPTPPSATKPLPDEKVEPASKTDTTKTDVGKPTKSAKMSLPVQGKIIRPYKKGKNEGIDIAGTAGGAISAAADGSVAAITSNADQVPIIVVRHPGNVLTVYANVDGIRVKKGDKVKRGQKLAKLRTGDDAYVHFEVREGFDSVDPSPYLE